jgi:hypothetical protein
MELLRLSSFGGCSAEPVVGYPLFSTHITDEIIADPFSLSIMPLIDNED